MDSVRFGRALGIGVREAAKAAVKAAEAAAAPKPGNAGQVAGGQDAGARVDPGERLREAVRQSDERVRGLKEGGRRFGEATFKPVARAGGVLWHEVMGVLFGLFVLVAGTEAWRGRGALVHGDGRMHEWFAVGMVVVFGYFTGSSFVKASRRGKR